MKSRILVCVCGADGEKPRYYRVFTGTINDSEFRLPFASRQKRQATPSNGPMRLVAHILLPSTTTLSYEPPWISLPIRIQLQNLHERSLHHLTVQPPLKSATPALRLQTDQPLTLSARPLCLPPITSVMNLEAMPPLAEEISRTEG